MVARGQGSAGAEGAGRSGMRTMCLRLAACEEEGTGDWPCRCTADVGILRSGPEHCGVVGVVRCVTVKSSPKSKVTMSSAGVWSSAMYNKGCEIGGYVQHHKDN